MASRFVFRIQMTWPETMENIYIVIKLIACRLNRPFIYYFVGAYKNAILIMVDIFVSGINKRLCFNYKKVMHSKKQLSSASQMKM